jgi:hypothetical protein
MAHRQHRVRQALRLAELEVELGVHQHRPELDHAVQCFDPALRLLGFAGLGLEAVDELLQVGDLFLLPAECRLLLLHALGAHGLEA